MLRGRKAVRADRRLRTDEKHIRAQSTILSKDKPEPSLLLPETAFPVRMCVYPYRKRGWRAQRANPFAASDAI
jgi:hypothetical protein